MTTVHVATLNIRNLADRWEERLPLLLADMAALQPDVMGLQEVVYPLQQDRVLAAAGPAHYAVHRGWAGRPQYGNATLVRAPLRVAAEERLDLGHNRSALRADIAPADGGATLRFVVTHLHHETPDEAIRDDQARELIGWLDALPDASATVVVGDFNAEPDEPTYTRMLAAGFRSAHAEANGSEPDVTWPSGIQAEGMDEDGPAGCLDYIWVRDGAGRARAESCRVVFDRPAVGDPTLYPSDHFGLSARIAVEPA